MVLEAKLLHWLPFHLSNSGVKVSQRFFDRQGVHLASKTFAGLEGLLQIMPSDFYSQRIGDHFAGALVVLHPGRVRQGDPNRFASDQKFVIDGVGVARGNGDDLALIGAMDRLFRPTICGCEVLKHTQNYIGPSIGAANSHSILDHPSAALLYITAFRH